MSTVQYVKWWVLPMIKYDYVSGIIRLRLLGYKVRTMLKCFYLLIFNCWNLLCLWTSFTCHIFNAFWIKLWLSRVFHFLIFHVGLCVIKCLTRDQSHSSVLQLSHYKEKKTKGRLAMAGKDRCCPRWAVGSSQSKWSRQMGQVLF